MIIENGTTTDEEGHVPSEDETIVDDTPVDAPADANPAEPAAPADGEPEQTDDEKAIAGFLKGVEEVSPHLKDADPAKKDEPAAKTPDAKGTPDPKAAPAQPDKAVDDEVKALGLKGAAEKRFRDMSTEIKTQRPLVEELNKVGVKDVEGLRQVMDGAARGLQWEDAIERSTANVEQVSSAFTVIRAMNSGDPKLMNAAYDALSEQVTALGKRLGRDAPGHDVLADHPDLAEAVENLEITRPHALELARGRAATKLEDERRSATTQQNEQAAAQQTAFDNAVKEGSAALDAFQAEMLKEDPQAAAKLPILRQQIVDGMLKDVHPAHWEAKVATAYAKLKIAAPAPRAAPRVGQQIMRGGARPAAAFDVDDKSEIGAFMKGVAAASD